MFIEQIKYIFWFYTNYRLNTYSKIGPFKRFALIIVVKYYLICFEVKKIFHSKEVVPGNTVIINNSFLIVKTYLFPVNRIIHLPRADLFIRFIITILSCTYNMNL